MVGAAAIDGFDGMCADAHSAPGKGGPPGTDGAGAEQRGAVKKLYGAGSRTGADVGGKGNGFKPGQLHLRSFGDGYQAQVARGGYERIWRWHGMALVG